MYRAPCLALSALVSVTMLSAVPAAADPPPPPDPLTEVPAPPPPPPLDPFAAVSAQTLENPAAPVTELLTGGVGGDPSSLASQAIGLSAPAPVDPLAAIGSLMPNSYRMPSGELPSPYVLQTAVPPGPFARVDALKGTHAMVHGALGRMPGAELGQPLPGTAPPPGTNIPPGLEQFYVDPASLPPPEPPVPMPLS